MHALMDLLNSFSQWQIAILIFVVRIVDVSLGTLRTISVVQGRTILSMVFGFIEVLIWIIALSQVITGVTDSPFLILAYAGGYAAGNAVGILLDRMLALGNVVIRMIATAAGDEVSAALRSAGHRVTTFQGQDRKGPVMLIYLICRRRQLAAVLQRAQSIEPEIFYSVEPVQVHSERLTRQFTNPNTWRAAPKKK